MEKRQRGLFSRQEALPVLRVQTQLLQGLGAELPDLVVLLGRREPAGQGGHQGGGEAQVLGQAGAEPALQVRDLRVWGVQSLLQARRGRGRRLQNHGPVRDEHGVPGVDQGSRTGLRGPPDQRVDAEGGAGSERPLHHHEG